MLCKFIEEGVKRFLCNAEVTPAVPAIARTLGLPDRVVLGTYDHLRSPFSNRILTGDERFSQLCCATETQGVLLVLDCTIVPASRCRGTQVGHTLGFSDFFRRNHAMDEVSVDRLAYFSYQKASPLIALNSEFWDRFQSVFMNLLRRDTKIPRRPALALSSVIVRRGRILESIYLTALSEAARKNESVAQALLRVRGKLRQYCGLKDVPKNIEIVLYSDIRRRLALAMDHFIEHIGVSHRFWSECTHFLGVNSDGYCCGKYEYEAETRKFFLKTSPQKGGAVSHRDMLALLAEGMAVPTTPMLYALLHLVGGIAHYGNSYGMNLWLSDILDISRSCVDITRDGSNSFPVGTIKVRIRKREVLLRNVSADLLWHTPSTYRKHIDYAVSTGRPAFSLNFVEDTPED